MWKLALMLTTAAAIAGLSLSAHNAGAESAGEKMAVTNIPESNQYLTREYRPGWGL